MKMLSLFKICLCFVVLSALLVKAEDPSSLHQPTSSSDQLNLTPYFLDIASLEITKVLPPLPGAELSEKNSDTPKQCLTPEEDLFLQECAMATATQADKDYAMSIIEDSVFDYSDVLGSNFTAENFPVTKVFFDKIRNDVIIACTTAKNIFQGPRPPSWTKMTPHDQDVGYTYPSGHSTRAFLCAALLSQFFQSYKEPLLEQAKRAAWSRVIIGRHYPSEVYAGKIYADYLLSQFLENKDFQKEWAAVQEEWREKSFFLPQVNCGSNVIL
ncbi:MAG: phosphatase PAP2 family protein [Verrucomicrobia bacterium]|nr:phosphatase PAP2 family protein [Verrucomicrobiota bacterium]